MMAVVPATLGELRRCSRATQVLLVSQLSFNIGFYMLVPYLAGHLGQGLGYASWLVGLLLGLRVLSQQGLFLVGGSIADRLGYRPVIIAGCVVRTVGFALFCLPGSSLMVVTTAIVLTGLAAALFSPAVQAYLALESTTGRVATFSLFNVAGEIGALLGPLVGVALLGVDFGAVAGVASATFAVITVAQLRFLPARPGVEAASPTSVLDDWRHAVSNRPFVAFALGMTGYAVLLNQIYLAIPLQVQAATGGQTGTAIVFALSSVVLIVGQSPVTRRAQRRRSPPGRMIVSGLAAMTAAFLPLLATSLVNGGRGDGAWSFAACCVAVTVLTAGTMLAQPVAMDVIPRLGGERRMGTYYGFYSLIAALAVVAGNSVGGLAFDIATRTGLPSLPWLVFTALGLASTGTLLGLHRARWLPGPPEPTEPEMAARA